MPFSFLTNHETTHSMNPNPLEKELQKLKASQKALEEEIQASSFAHTFELWKQREELIKKLEDQEQERDEIQRQKEFLDQAKLLTNASGLTGLLTLIESFLSAHQSSFPKHHFANEILETMQAEFNTQSLPPTPLDHFIQIRNLYHISK